MESSSVFVGGMSPKQPPPRRHTLSGHGRDLWGAARNGNVHDVEYALTHLKKTNGNIDARNAFGSSALHIAAWRNHLPIVRRLLAAGADPNIRDGESGWSSLHRALHFGHLAVAGVLIEAGGSLALEDSKGRTPVDLTSMPLKQSLGSSANAGANDVYSWGNGSNYQLGIGINGILRVPGRVDALHGLGVTAVAAAKFHSVALTANGDLYSWGFGRGGRLGHPDFDIHSGQVAVITPRQIAYSFGSQVVSVIAVAKHHTMVATNGGAVYTWGSNREGRLGYPSVDTQPTPRRVSTLKARVVAVSAANKHSAVLTDAGEVYTWGCNTEGQLGYGTSNSISNYTPHLVECLQGRKFVAISTAKYHTLVLGAEGEVLTWGYRMVNPRRIPVVRYTKKAGSLPLKFHISERLHVVAISAGMTHSLALSEDGLVFYWFSADHQLRCHQLLSMAGHQAVAVSSSKYRTAIVTSTGDVFSWDGENSRADTIVVPRRVNGIKHASQLSVGENHSVVVAAIFIPEDLSSNVSGMETSNLAVSIGDEDEPLDYEVEDELYFGDVLSHYKGRAGTNDVSKTIPSLKDLCQRVAAQAILEPKNALQALEFAESLGADFLRGHCEELILRNLDYILTVAPGLFGNVRSCLLARVEKALYSCLICPWGQHRFSCPNAASTAVIDSDDEKDGAGRGACTDKTRELSIFNKHIDRKMGEGFLQQSTEINEIILKQVRAARKKLQQIEALELKQTRGLMLDDQQVTKLRTKPELENLLLSLEAGVIPESKNKHQTQDTKDGYAENLDRENPNRRSDSKQTHRSEKKGKKKKASSESSIRSVDSERRDASLISTSDKKSLEKSMLREDIIDCSQKMTGSSFVKISGFSSHAVNGSERDALSLSDVKGKTKVMGDPSLLTDESPVLSNQPKAGPVRQPVQSPLPRKMTTLGKKVTKGGLSVFLSGALDEPPEAVLRPAPVIPKVEGSAWGGAHSSSGLTSLRDIQSEQKIGPKLVFSQALKIGSGSWERGVSSSKQGGNAQQIPGAKSLIISKQAEKSQISIVTETSGNRVPLSQFVRTSPIAVIHHQVPAVTHLDNSPPPWAASTSSTTALSLRDIQLEQVKSKAQQHSTHSAGSPSFSSPGGALALLAGGSGVAHTGNSQETPNRWLKPESSSPSTLRCIQIEEKAMKELRQLYKNVKLVRDKS